MNTTRLQNRQRRQVVAGRFGRAQLSLVEHALCPLDRALTLQPNFVFETSYFFTDRNRNRKQAHVRIGGLDGLSPHDEFYLWGLLSLALTQSDPQPDFLATPYYCLKHLGIITAEKRGGREFELFRTAIKRLAGIRYQNDLFYDPIRGEHRAVSCGFLNYSLPLNPNTPSSTSSTRAWRFAWDPIFFELAQATGGALSFDLSLYRKLDPATRRLFLFLKKQFWRKEETGALDLHDLAVQVLGFSPTIETSHLKRKVARCIDQLIGVEFLELPSDITRTRDLFVKKGKSVYSIRLQRGPAFNTVSFPNTTMAESPLVDPLRSIGFDQAAIARILSRCSPRIIEQWSDITLAAMERHGPQFFKKSPQAYFMDNVVAATDKRRTPPDWWRELRKQELNRQREQNQIKAKLVQRDSSLDSFEEYLRTEARETFDRISHKLLEELRQAGKSEAEAQEFARRSARTHLRHKFHKEHPEADASDGFQSIGSLL